MILKIEEGLALLICLYVTLKLMLYPTYLVKVLKYSKERAEVITILEIAPLVIVLLFRSIWVIFFVK